MNIFERIAEDRAAFPLLRNAGFALELKPDLASDKHLGRL